MAKSRQPTVKDIQELLAFSPKLYADGFEPIKHWTGGGNKDGTDSFAYPIYDKLVDDFVTDIGAHASKMVMYVGC